MIERDAHLALGSASHYEDAAYYEHAYKRRREDVAFYVELAQRFGGPVLELGVGAGRVARKLAESGLEVLGVDASLPMLALAEERRAKMKRAARDRLALMAGDLFELRLGQRFPLVISPFNVFMHVYDRLEFSRAMETVRAHLSPGGVFVFDVLVPDPAALARDPDRLYRSRDVKLPPDGRPHRYRERFEYDPVRQIQTVTIYLQPVDDPNAIVTQTLTHRQYFPAELEALLHHEDFSIVERYGDFSGGPLDEFSESQILVVRTS